MKYLLTVQEFVYQPWLAARCVLGMRVGHERQECAGPDSQVAYWIGKAESVHVKHSAGMYK